MMIFNITIGVFVTWFLLDLVYKEVKEYKIRQYAEKLYLDLSFKFSRLLIDYKKNINEEWIMKSLGLTYMRYDLDTAMRINKLPIPDDPLLMYEHVKHMFAFTRYVTISELYSESRSFYEDNDARTYIALAHLSEYKLTLTEEAMKTSMDQTLDMIKNNIFNTEDKEESRIN